MIYAPNVKRHPVELRLVRKERVIVQGKFRQVQLRLLGKERHMKLSKAKLIKMVKTRLEDLGYTEFKESTGGSQGFFVKYLGNGFYLTLGLTIHRYYDSAFTGDFYLSKTTRWAAVWGDIPRESFQRPSFLLTDAERSVYLEDEINVKGARDIWWDGSNEDSVLDFLRVIEVTEPRFVNQPGLFQIIEQSQGVKTLADYSEAVRRKVALNDIGGSFSFLPTKEVDMIPIVWFKAAEKVLIERKGVLNANTVRLLAADAYRQNRIVENQHQGTTKYQGI
jgi:hypothetical protein